MENKEKSCCETTCCSTNDAGETLTAIEPDDHESIRNSVREKYAAIAVQNKANGCCTGPENLEVSFVGDSYDNVEGHVAEADLGLGCGLPTEFAQIKPGHIVVDLGSGAGNDVFIARQETGEKGKVYGIDFTPEMVAQARKNAQKLGYENVHFFQGDIEDIPLEGNIADVMVSNCVLNLVPNKEKAFSEMHRVLKPGGHFSISDIVTLGRIPDELRKEAELYAGCVAGAMPKEDYMDLVQKAGFKDVVIQKERMIEIPEFILDQVLAPDKKELYQKSEIGIFSLTVFGRKA